MFPSFDLKRLSSWCVRFLLIKTDWTLLGSKRDVCTRVRDKMLLLLHCHTRYIFRIHINRSSLSIFKEFFGKKKGQTQKECRKKNKMTIKSREIPNAPSRSTGCTFRCDLFRCRRIISAVFSPHVSRGRELDRFARSRWFSGASVRGRARQVSKSRSSGCKTERLRTRNRSHVRYKSHFFDLCNRSVLRVSSLYAWD